MLNKKIKLNEFGWFWPNEDVKCWDGQKRQDNIYNDIAPFLKNKRIMLQAGGNCGYVLSKFVEHFEHIYTFEPDPVNFYCLNLNILNENVTKLQCCIGDKNELVGIFNYVPDIGGVHVKGSGHTPCIKIDDLNLPYCDLIQLDIEGYEYKALLGAKNTILKHHPVLCLEWCEKWANRYNVTQPELINLLTEWNYEFVANSGVDKIYIFRE